MQRLSSVQNPVVKRLRSLERARNRRDEGLYIAEGVRLITEAIETGQQAEIALIDPEAMERSSKAGNCSAGSTAGQTIPMKPTRR
jgi:TrmH family RNA methyltransferase